MGEPLHDRLRRWTAQILRSCGIRTLTLRVSGAYSRNSEEGCWQPMSSPKSSRGVGIDTKSCFCLFQIGGEHFASCYSIAPTRDDRRWIGQDVDSLLVVAQRLESSL